MKQVLQLEEVAMFIFSIYLFSLTDFQWWIYPALILAPDVSMLGYLVSSRVGAMSYNFFHHKAVAISVLILGEYLSSNELILAGIIFFGHSSLDRILGYGLKFSDSFFHTHLGWIGKGAPGK